LYVSGRKLLVHGEKWSVLMNVDGLDVGNGADNDFFFAHSLLSSQV